MAELVADAAIEELRRQVAAARADLEGALVEAAAACGRFAQVHAEMVEGEALCANIQCECNLIHSKLSALAKSKLAARRLWRAAVQRVQDEAEDYWRSKHSRDIRALIRTINDAQLMARWKRYSLASEIRLHGED